MLAATIAAQEDMLPFFGWERRRRTAAGRRRQRSADGPLTFWQVLDVISERSPSATELQHPRQDADIHVDRAIGDAGVVTYALEVSDDRSCDRGERHMAKVLLDDAEPLLLGLDRAW